MQLKATGLHRALHTNRAMAVVMWSLLPGDIGERQAASGEVILLGW